MNFNKLKCPSINTKNSHFFQLIKPILKKADKLYWITDSEAEPVNIAWVFTGANEAVLEQTILDVEAFENTSVYLHRPGMISKYGRFLINGEQVIYIGIEANGDSEASKKAINLFRSQFFKFDDANFISVFKDNAVIFVYYYDSSKTGLHWDILLNNDDKISRLKFHVSRFTLKNMVLYLFSGATWIVRLSRLTSASVLMSLPAASKNRHKCFGWK